MAAFLNWSNEGAQTLANSLSNLGQSFGQAIEKQGKLQSAQSMGQKIASNDLNGAMQDAFNSGDVDLGLKLYKQADEQKWLSELSPQLSGNNTTLSPLTSPATTSGAPLDLPSSNQARGDRNNNPGNIIDSKYTQNLPGYVGGDGKFAQFATPQAGFNAQVGLIDKYNQQGINTVAGIVSKWAPQSENGASTQNYIATVAKDLNVDPNQPLDLTDKNLQATLARSMAGVELGHKYEIPTGAIGGYGGQPSQTIQTAQNNPSLSGNPGVANDGTPAPAGSGQKFPFGASSWQDVGIKTSKILANPGFSRAPASFQEQVKLANQQAVQWMQLENSNANLPANKLTAETAARRELGVKMGLKDKELDSFALTGDIGKLDSTFQKGMSEASAKRWSGVIAEGDKARNASADIEKLAELNKSIGTDNNLAGLRSYIADLTGVALGDNISDIQVFSSLIDKLAPQMHVPGSGASSDLDVKGMKQSLPSLMKTPEGRAEIIKQMQGLNQYTIDRSIIAERLDNQEISQSQAAKLIRGLRATDYVKTGGRPEGVASMFVDDAAIPRANPMPEGKPMVHRRDQPQQTQQQPKQQQPQNQTQNPKQDKPLNTLPASELAKARQAIGSGQKTYAQVKSWLESNGFNAEGL